MTRPADWRQRAQALDPDRSCIVQAPAGSGKTELLIQRMLRLLAVCEQPEEVVAITFTRKAAREMSRRLLEAIRDAEEPGLDDRLSGHKRLSRQLALAVLERDRDRGWNISRQPSRLRIRTIDSLCAELARQLPVEAGLGAAHRVSEDPESLYRLAARRAMSVIEDERDSLHGDVAHLLAHYDNQYDRLVELLSSMLGTRDQWLPAVLARFDGEHFDRAGLEAALQRLVEVTLRELSGCFPPACWSELLPLLAFAAGNLDEGSAALEALIERAGGAPPGLRDRVTDLAHWRTLADCLLVKNGKAFRKSVTVQQGFPAPSSAHVADRQHFADMKQGFGSLLTVLADIEALPQHLHAARLLPDPVYPEDAWRILTALLRVLLRTVQEWQLLAMNRGEVDFIEIAARAGHALGTPDNPGALALRLDHRVRHLLVDEFQDTSSGQVGLIESLTGGWQQGDGRTLFLVGDPMQSIYRFRKAEVALFIEAWEGRLFPHLQLEPLRLQVNFRSNVPIVQWVNRVFAGVMPGAPDPVLGAVPYSAAEVRPDASQAGQVDLSLTPFDDRRDEARRIVSLIDAAGEEETIGVLVRARSHAAELLEALDGLKGENPRYRYRAVDFFPLATTPMIRDLVSLTLALCQPADRLAWLSVLRAPFIGLSLADLEALTDNDPNGIIADALATCADRLHQARSLSADGRMRLQRAAPVLLAGLAQRGHGDTRDRVEAAWLQLGGPACACNPSELTDAETYWQLLSRLQARHQPIERDVLESELEHLFAQPDSLATGHLHVMTLFAAKGLQFDRVIVPGLNRGTSGDSGRLLHWFEMTGSERIVMAPMRDAREKSADRTDGDLVGFVADAEKRRAQMETGRLAYVAATRAISRLHLLGAVTPNAGEEFKPKSGSLLDSLWPAVGAEQQAVLEQAWAEGPGEQAEQAAPSTTGLVRRLPADWKLPDPPEPVPAGPAPEFVAGAPIEFSWAGEDARLGGVLVHRLLERIAVRGLSHWQDAVVRDRYRGWCESSLASKGVVGERARNIVNSSLAAVDACLASETGRWILQPHDHAQSEYQLTLVRDASPRHWVIDRSFVDGGIRWIIDFKTSRHAGGDLEGFLEQERERYTRQMTDYRAAMALRETRPIRCALYYPVFDRLVEIG